jgi:hypothetical protein
MPTRICTPTAAAEATKEHDADGNHQASVYVKVVSMSINIIDIIDI